MLLHNNH